MHVYFLLISQALHRCINKSCKYCGMLNYQHHFIVCIGKAPQIVWFSPGNRIISAARPLCCNACTSVWHCVVFPALSTPSRTIKAPLLQDMALENNWKCATEPLENNWKCATERRQRWHWLANNFNICAGFLRYPSLLLFLLLLFPFFKLFVLLYYRHRWTGVYNRINIFFKNKTEKSS